MGRGRRLRSIASAPVLALFAAALCLLAAPQPVQASAETVLVCHRPPGNPANRQILSVGASAVSAHLRNHPDNLLAEDTCDGIDNDCDGALDENLGTLTCGVGICTTTVESCVSGAPQICVPGSPSPETCDGLDNDCNGFVDDTPDIIGGIDVGLCQPQVERCIDGALVIVQERVDPQPEVCNDGLDQDCDGEVDDLDECLIPPVVRITQPAGTLLVSSDTAEVRGTVDDPDVTLVVNGVSVPIAAGEPPSFSAIVPIREGNNTITATATNAQGGVGSASVLVIRDTTPPMVVVESPTHEQIVTSEFVTIVGSVNDIVTGTVNQENCSVEITGRTGSVRAAVRNRTFLVENFPVVPGENTLTAVATDTAGNVSRPFALTVRRLQLVGQRLELAAGNAQTGAVGQALPAPVAVRALDASGNPIPDRALTFRVVRNNGLVRSSESPEPATATVVRTDASGTASVEWTLGTRVGVGNNRLEVSAPGFPAPVLVCASAEAGACEQILAGMGGNQVGLTGSPLARPFEVMAIDAGGNACIGTPVTFTVQAGGGSFGGNPEITIETNSDGRAAAVLTLGSQPGVNNQVASATFPGVAGQPATFITSAAVPVGTTRFSGTVLDTENRPIPNAHVTIHGTSLETYTSDQGQFALGGVPAGPGLLIVNAATTTRSEMFPALEFQIDVVTGIENTLGMPIFIPFLDQDNFRQVGVQDAVLEMDGVEGFSLKVFAGSASNPDGTPYTGVMGVTQVSNDQVPMPPSGGAAPPWVGTLQPAGIHLDPPAQLTVPNALGLPEGQIIDLFSFDHDLQQFVGVGTGTVQPGGAKIVSDPGSGIIKSGWFFDCPPPPPTQCTASACQDPDPKDCTRVTGNTCPPGCMNEPEPNGKQCMQTLSPLPDFGQNGLCQAGQCDTCPQGTTIVATVPIPLTGASVAQGIRTGVGAQTTTQVTPSNVDWAGAQIVESVSLVSNTCGAIMASACSNTGGFSTFTVGVAGKNRFFDYHSNQRGVSVLHSIGSQTCKIVCEQTYSCGGNTIGTHTITRNLSRSVIGGTDVSVIGVAKQ